MPHFLEIYKPARPAHLFRARLASIRTIKVPTCAYIYMYMPYTYLKVEAISTVTATKRRTRCAYSTGSFIGSFVRAGSFIFISGSGLVSSIVSGFFSGSVRR